MNLSTRDGMNKTKGWRDMKPQILLSLLAMVLVTFVVACGGGDDKKGGPNRDRPYRTTLAAHTWRWWAVIEFFFADFTVLIGIPARKRPVYPLFRYDLGEFFL